MYVARLGSFDVDEARLRHGPRYCSYLVLRYAYHAEVR